MKATIGSMRSKALAKQAGVKIDTIRSYEVRGLLPDIPIACALNQTQFAKRKRLLDRLAQQAIKRRRLPNGVSLCFAANSGRVTELAKFVDLERDCCPFLTFRIDVGAGESIWLKLTGPPAARELILGLIPEAASNG
jgi:hypothetical protein